MKILRTQVWIIFTLLSASQMSSAASPAESYDSMIRKMTPAARETARSNAVHGMKVFELAQTTNSYKDLLAFIESCKRESSLLTNGDFLMPFVGRIESRAPAQINDSEMIEVPSRVKAGKMQTRLNVIVVRQDILIQGGRAAWCLEQLLGCELPEISEVSSEGELQEAAIDALYCVSEALLPPNAPRTVAGLSTAQKRRLAEAEDSNEVILAKLSKDADRSVRMAVAANKNTPIHLLVRLGYHEKDEDIRKAARKNSERSRSLN